MLSGTLVYVFLLASCGRSVLSASEGAAECSHDSEYILSTKSGQLKGKCQNVVINEPANSPTKSGSVYSWLSVPYAEAPIDKNRFMKTYEKKPWTGQLDATKPGPACIQEDSLYLRTDYDGLNMWKSKSRQSEDCLFLNIWAPADAYNNINKTSAVGLPILVFFHGGGSTHGSASDLNLYDPSTFVAISNVIVITVNYRLGVFGFLKLDSLFPGNQALYDQNEALRWIYKNAAMLGGDAEKVTLSGHGSGATLASYHLFIKQSHYFFRNIILQSGTPLVSSMEPIPTTEANRRATQLIEYIGCHDNVVDCLQASSMVANASVELFRAFTKSDYVTQTHFKTFFPPSIDTILLVVKPEESLATGHFKQCSVLTGFSAHEGSMLIGQTLVNRFKSLQTNAVDRQFFTEYLTSYFSNLGPNHPDYNNQIFIDLVVHEYTKQTAGTETLNVPQDLLTKLNFFRQLTRILSDQAYVCPAYRLADVVSQLSNNVYMYLYSHRVSTTPWPRQYGAVHGDDLAFTFAFPLQIKNISDVSRAAPWSMPNGDYFRNEKLLANEITNYWANFIKYDSPNDPEKEEKWPVYKHRSQDTESSGRNSEPDAKYMVFKSTGNRVSSGYSLENCILWNSYLPRMLKMHETLVREALDKVPECPTTTEAPKITCPTVAPTTSAEKSKVSTLATMLAKKQLKLVSKATKANGSIRLTATRSVQNSLLLVLTLALYKLVGGGF